MVALKNIKQAAREDHMQILDNTDYYQPCQNALWQIKGQQENRSRQKNITGNTKSPRSTGGDKQLYIKVIIDGGRKVSSSWDILTELLLHVHVCKYSHYLKRELPAVCRLFKPIILLCNN